MYLLTRPQPKLLASVWAFEKAGLTVSGIAPITLTMVALGIEQLRQKLLRCPPDIAIVTSTFAAKIIIEHCPLPSQNIIWLCVGGSTRRILESASLQIYSPTEETSEGLLALDTLTDVKSRQIVIIKGVGGRTTLTEMLTTRQASVAEFEVYRRQTLHPPQETNQWRWTDVKGIIATSGEMMDRLFDEYPSAKLKAMRWLTVSQRIAHRLQNHYGITDVSVCNSASDTALIAWLKDNWE